MKLTRAQKQEVVDKAIETVTETFYDGIKDADVDKIWERVADQLYWTLEHELSCVVVLADEVKL